ncbi:MAG: peptidase, partial [Rhodanobacter sp.]
MTKQYLKPLALALAVSVALSLSACGKQEDAAKAPASVAPAASSTTAAVDAGKSIFDISELDPNIKACQDFNGFVNAKWVAANPIPADHTSWGAFNKLAEDSLNTQHAIVEAAAKNAATAKAGSIEQKIGYLYHSGMDDAAIEKAGFDPIKPKLDAIAALKNGSDVADYLDK